jgi:hypothetical protein
MDALAGLGAIDKPCGLALFLLTVTISLYFILPLVSVIFNR